MQIVGLPFEMFRPNPESQKGSRATSRHWRATVLTSNKKESITPSQAVDQYSSNFDEATDTVIDVVRPLQA